ncbi:hypothetical protein GZH53_02500 [Flavihumibacter sp. R14]|nr:hypothetical protein [Flavihumibacter soli]
MEQNYSNHPRIVKPFHGLLFLLLLVGLAGSVVNLVKSRGSDNLYSASLLVLLFVICTLISWYTRSFPLKAQDRAIRAEENLRYFILTGKPLPEDLKMGQIVALRFAPDEEFPGLTERCIRENLSGKEIKMAIKNWKPDLYRV